MIIKIPLCPITECNIEWTFNVIDDNDNVTYTDIDTDVKHTKLAKDTPSTYRPMLKSEVTVKFLNDINVKRKSLIEKEKIKKDKKGNARVNTKETNHFLEFGKTCEVVQLFCEEDVEKIKLSLGLK